MTCPRFCAHLSFRACTCSGSCNCASNCTRPSHRSGRCSSSRNSPRTRARSRPRNGTSSSRSNDPRSGSCFGPTSRPRSSLCPAVCADAQLKLAFAAWSHTGRGKLVLTPALYSTCSVLPSPWSLPVRHNGCPLRALDILGYRRYSLL